MYLIYLDESGNSGNNLNDVQQPVFVLCAMIVPEDQWLKLERDLAVAVDKYFPPPRPDDFEIHGTELRTARGFCKGMSVSARVAFRDEWMDIAAGHEVKLIHRAIEKKRYQKWLHASFGTGVAINPHVAAFALVARVVDDYLKALPGSPLGMFISDDNKEIVADVEKSIRVLRGAGGALRLGQIIEKGFFIDSAHSLPLQLCDLFALSLRKHEEIRTGMPAKSVDASGIKRAEILAHRGIDAYRDVDVIAWLTQQQNDRKKKRPGDKPGVGRNRLMLAAIELSVRWRSKSTRSSEQRIGPEAAGSAKNGSKTVSGVGRVLRGTDLETAVFAELEARLNRISRESGQGLCLSILAAFVEGRRRD